MRTRWKPRPRYEDTLKYRYNEWIRVPEILVIDENNKSLGKLVTAEALGIARERGYDVVEVNPNANPPVCKFLNYGQFQYEERKRQQAAKSKQKRVEVKGIRLSLRIGPGDLETRRKQAERFLDEGNMVKAEVILRGREKAHADLAGRNIMEFIKSLSGNIVIEQSVTREAGRLSAIVRRGGEEKPA